ncbi:MAG: plasmid pRiA4b ORF-3-like [Alphaproteobacteria bacterium]|nr:MAG: plasmid pRiA4b ORF-3-like [Alphaproteobacteria bacterium]
MAECLVDQGKVNSGLAVRLKITLDDVTPQVMWRVEVPLSIRLDRLHLVMQAAMGWENYHLWEFRVQGVGFGPPDPDDGFPGPLNAAKATLRLVLEDTGAKTLKYLYDFGDGWEHTVKVERILDATPGLDLPILIAAHGACPPEDVGGPPGYDEFRAAVADPKHERHEEMLEWRGPDFSADDPDLDRINADLATLAKRWARKPTARRSAKR